MGSAIALMGGFAIAFSGNCTLAQSNIVPDNTLGAESSFVEPNFNGLPVEAIGGGALRGQNLFHSFEEFNVSEGRGAYFFSPDAAIQNILARVTGNNPSQILGTLGTFGESTPNLFLINPNGIIFGQNASLEVGGSFIATTANAIRLGDTGLFSASEPQTSNLLAINPNAFFYNQLSNQGQIINRSTATTTVLGTPTIGLQVSDGRSLLLVGGDVSLEGGLVFAPGGRVELGGVAQNGTVELTTNGNELRLGFLTDVARADVSLTNEAEVNVRAGGGGSIAINARDLDVLGGSKVRAGIASGLGSPDSQTGDIEVNTTGTTTIVGEQSFLANVVQPGGVGKAGDINIATGSLFVSNGGQVNTLTQGQGDVGSVTIVARDTVSFEGTDRFGIFTGSSSVVEEGAIGNAGGINITTGSLFVTNGAQLDTSTLGQGNSGSVRIIARDIVTFDGFGTNGFFSGALSDVNIGAVGNSGGIEIDTGSLEVTNGALLSASNLGQGNAGSVRITARDTVTFDGVGSNGFSTAVFSDVNTGAVGNSGGIEIDTGSLEVANGAFLSASTFGEGSSGSVRITARDTVTFDGIGTNGFSSAAFSNVATGAMGDGSDIEIDTGSLKVSNGAQLFASAFGQSNAGNVRINARDTVTFDGVGSNGFSSSASSSVGETGVGDGGNIEINTGSLEVINGAYLSAGTNGQGNAGSVRITARDTVHFDGVGTNGVPSSASSSVRETGVGDGGDIDIFTSVLAVTNKAALSTNTLGQGNAGSVRIIARDTVRLDGANAFTNVGQTSVGNGGDIEISTGSLEVTNGASLFAATAGWGNAGSVRITARDTVRFDGVGSNQVPSSAFSSVGETGVGDGGDIVINAGSLEVINDAGLNASTSGKGNAGNVRISAQDTVYFNGGGASSSVQETGVGDGGDIVINARSLEVTNRAQLSSSTFGRGDAGNVKITANDTVYFDGGTASSFVYPTAVGNGGDIVITTGSLTASNGISLLSSTLGQGNAGNIKITASDTISFDRGAAYSSVEPGGEGNGGNIEITSGSLFLTDFLISSESQGTGGAGDIIIETRQNLELDRSNISATTQADDGGNIRLQVRDLLLLRNDSNISTTAGIAGAGGNGGNISIKAGFVVAVPKEDSDITANAFNGRGGNINITTQGIYGLEYRERLTSLSDITASSEFGLNGEFQLDLLTNVDPRQGLTNLPTDVVDATRQIDNRCTPAAADKKSSFVITGRGGLPPSPNEVLQGESVITPDWVTLDSEADNISRVTRPMNSTRTVKPLVEAQGWVYGAKGEVILTAQVPSVTPYNAGSISCE